MLLLETYVSIAPVSPTLPVYFPPPHRHCRSLVCCQVGADFDVHVPAWTGPRYHVLPTEDEQRVSLLPLCRGSFCFVPRPILRWGDFVDVKNKTKRTKTKPKNKKIQKEITSVFLRTFVCKLKAPEL